MEFRSSVSLLFASRQHAPMSNKRCFLNGVFQSGVLRGWTGSARAEHAKMPENTGVFRHSLSLGKSLPLSRVEVRNLKNTVWKTPFGTLRMPKEATPGHKRKDPKRTRTTPMKCHEIPQNLFRDPTKFHQKPTAQLKPHYNMFTNFLVTRSLWPRLCGHP